MAKWGEGDPRWIVEQRADATNVNNWHWSEKNATQWSKDKIKALLTSLKIVDGTYEGEITEISTLEGEATANNRKSKLIFFYEWEIKGSWKGKKSGEKTSYKGKFQVLNLSEEYDASELDVSFTAESTKDDSVEVKEFMRTKGVAPVQEALATYIKELKEEYGKNLILPTDKSPTAATKQAKSESSPVANVTKQTDIMSLEPNSNPTVGVKIACKKLTDSIQFKCRVEDIYRALTVRDMVMAFTRGEVVDFCAAKGERFSFFGGNVTGEFIKLQENKEIEMKWRFKTWPTEHYSNVKLRFEEKDDCTYVHITQTGIPEKEFERTQSGWHQYYWESIKHTFGFGSRLF